VSALTDAAEALYAALATVDGVRFHRGIGVTIDPPATAVGPPEIERDVYGPDPTGALFQVAVIVAKTEYALDELVALEQPVVEALQAIPDAAVQSPSKPGVWPSGGVDLPAYLIDIAFAL